MFCANCGADMGQANFCPSCGAQAQTPQSAYNTADTSANFDNTVYPDQNFNNNSGYNQNFNQGYNQNYNQGYNQNYNQGYNQNYNQGYNQSYAPVENFNIITAYKSLFKKYAQFNGRSRRSEYWLAYLMNSLILIFFYLILFIPLIGSAVNGDVPSGGSLALTAVGGMFILVYALVILVPSLAMTVRRLHDTGRSGWYLLLSLIPYVGSIVIFVFTVLDSQPGMNQYGPNPKGL